jgi:hypothetical protein
MGLVRFCDMEQRQRQLSFSHGWGTGRREVHDISREKGPTCSFEKQRLTDKLRTSGELCAWNDLVSSNKFPARAHSISS